VAVAQRRENGDGGKGSRCKCGQCGQCAKWPGQSCLSGCTCRQAKAVDFSSRFLPISPHPLSLSSRPFCAAAWEPTLSVLVITVLPSLPSPTLPCHLFLGWTRLALQSIPSVLTRRTSRILFSQITVVPSLLAPLPTEYSALVLSDGRSGRSYSPCPFALYLVWFLRLEACCTSTHTASTLPATHLVPFCRPTGKTTRWPASGSVYIKSL
jgi:hypothetical protein